MTILFTDVEIIEHPVIFDTTIDLKSGHKGLFCKAGGPLTQLAWDSQSRSTIDIDIYEVTRDKRRGSRELHLSKSERTELLQQSGYPLHEIDRRLLRAEQRSKEEQKKEKLLSNIDGNKSTETPSEETSSSSVFFTYWRRNFNTSTATKQIGRQKLSVAPTWMSIASSHRVAVAAAARCA